MTAEVEKWNKLSNLFDTHCNEDEIDPLAADNMIIAWPVLLKHIESYAASKNKTRVTLLDYGCGTGGFCIKLDSLGYTVIGIDFATEEAVQQLSHCRRQQSHFNLRQSTPLVPSSR